MVIDALDRDRRVVDENADREGETAERHHIDGFAGGRQERDRGQNRQRNRDHDDDGRTPAAEKDQDHETSERRGHHALDMTDDTAAVTNFDWSPTASRRRLAAGSDAISATAP